MPIKFKDMGNVIKDRDAFYLLIVVIVSLGTGYWLLSQTLAESPKGAPPWSAAIAISIAGFALLLNRSASSQPQPKPDQTNTNSLPQPSPMALYTQILPEQLDGKRIGLFLLATIFLGYSLVTIPQLTLTDSYLTVTLSWLLAILLCLTAVLPWSKPTWPRQLPNKQFVAGLVGLGLLTILLRTWQLGTIPFTLGGDEASQGLEAVRVLDGTLRNPLATGWLGVPTMSFFFNSATIALFGRTIFGLRIAWVLVGTLNVLVTFWLVRRLQGEKLAWLTAVLLATYHYHIHYSRLGSNQIADPLFLSLALWFLYRAIDLNRRRDWSLIGLVCGFAFYFYAGARLTPVIVIAVISYLFILNPRDFWAKHQSGIWIMLLVFLFVVAPMGQYAARFPGEFNARINQVGVFQSGWIEQEMAAQGKSMVAVLWDQFQRAALAFTYYPDRTVWYGLPEPLLNPLFSTFFLCGLLYGTLRLLGKETGLRLAPMVAWWWGGMILGGMLTESPPSSQRLITLSVPVCFFIALAFWEIATLAKNALSFVSRDVLLVAGALAFGFSSLSTYFIDYTPQRIYGGRHAELATELASPLNGLKEEHRIYFVGAPWMYWDFSTLPYLVADVEAYNVAASPTTPPTTADVVAEGKGAVYIFLPERLEELPLVEQAFPNGTFDEIVSPIDGRLMATLYKVTPSN